MSDQDVQIAIPEGRLFESVMPMLEASGLYTPNRTSNDVTVNVVNSYNAFEMMANENGYSDICVVSSEAFLEEWIENWQYARDLQVARRRLSLVVKKGNDPTGKSKLTVATHFPLVAQAHLQVDDVQLDLVDTPLGATLFDMLNTADVAVDVIAEDQELDQQGLVELRKICPVSAHALVSQRTLDRKRYRVEYVLKRMMGLVGAGQSRNAA